VRAVRQDLHLNRLFSMQRGCFDRPFPDNLRNCPSRAKTDTKLKHI
jgi:hypothetical protein